MGIEIQMTGKPRSTENRQAKRYKYQGETTVRRLEANLALPGRILDLSLNGCLLRLPDVSNLDVDALVDMDITSRAVAFRALGSVRHCSLRRQLVGISFVNLNRTGKDALNSLIADLESA
jgi:hypothetical protein